MAEEEKNESEEPEEGQEEASEKEPMSPAKKRSIFLGGGILGLVVVAYFVAMMAVPAEPEETPLLGPFVAPLSEGRIQVNLSGEGNKRFLVMELQAIFEAYEETYMAERLADPLYGALLGDALIDVSSKKTRDEVTDPTRRSAFKEEIRFSVEPILFPVHVGDAKTPYDLDTESGVAMGDSRYSATLRGLLFDHRIELNAVETWVRLDEGEPVVYQGDETDLLLRNEQGEVVFLDVSNVTEGWIGDCLLYTSPSPRDPE